MAAKQRDRRSVPVSLASPVSSPSRLWVRLAAPRVIAMGFVVAVFCFYFNALFDSAASIQWDAVDVQYSAQRYLADFLHAGKLPFWTPYLFSGMPFLADPQVGAWYPLNWPFLLLGITPRAIQAQIALHCLIAALGAWLLARDLLRSRAGAVFAGVLFAFSGLFAETSSHVGPFQATSLLPWLLWTGWRASRSPRWLPALAIASGCLVLTGHFQTALYSFFALAIFLIADFAISRASLLRTLGALAVAAVAAVTLPAVMILPGMELTANSIRAGADYSRDAGAALVPGALATLVSPDHYGAPEVEGYTGPPDITQFYLYMGILCVPLALAGLAAARERWYALALVVPGAWYAFGPPGGLYSLIARMPGFANVRAPIQMWFVAAMGLALLAGAGIGVLRTRVRAPWVVLALLVFTGGDLYYWNMSQNRLAYARESFQNLYGTAQERFRTAAAPLMSQPMYRIHSAIVSPSFGPFNGTLDTRMEVTFGYNPLELARYQRYLDAAAKNPLLLNSLSVTAALNPNGMFVTLPSALPRIFAPASVSAARNREEAAARLAALDPAAECVAEGVAPIANNGGVQVNITAYEGDLYRARYHSDHAALLRAAVPYFPGWQAEVDGRAAPVLPVDLALTGVVVPAGSHELVFRYRPARFYMGLAISTASWLVVLGALVFAAKAPGAPRAAAAPSDAG